MTKHAFLLIISLFLFTLPILGDGLPQVLQPNTTAYSASEVATLTQAIATLEKALNDYNLASRHYFPDEWTSRNFAMYTAGVLSEKGYETVLVSGVGWPEGVHTWVLVGVPLGARTSWIPIEATPEAGHSQQSLGYIPGTTDTAGKMWFDTRYVSFGNVIDLPPNIPPIARIRKPVSALVESESSRILGMTSVDPDGEIVLYRWDFGDGDSETTVTWTVRHVFSKQGDYIVHLTVTDSRGSTASTSLGVRVLSTAEANDTSGGCGCGK
jgi:hypothetical protein